MINPNVCKLVRVEVLPCQTKAMYRGHAIDINDYRIPAPTPGMRRMWLKYSIMSDSYYLTAMTHYIAPVAPKYPALALVGSAMPPLLERSFRRERKGSVRT